MKTKGKSIPAVRRPTHVTKPDNLNLKEREQWEQWMSEKERDLKAVRKTQFGKRRALTLLEMANEKKKELMEADRCDVELQVLDVAHARSSEVLGFCLAHLGKGGTWSSLRHKLGLGLGDIRWRLIRERAVEGLLPVNEDEAIKAVGSQRTFLVQKLEHMLETLEARMELFTAKQGAFAQDKDFWKLKTEIMKLLLEENSKNLMDHLEVKKAKALDKTNQGVSIVVQNAYYIPRPGDDKDRIRDVVPLINELTEQTRILEAALVDSKELQTDKEST